jgi:hypothetical protein
MPTLAVQVTALSGSQPNSKQGILIANPRIGDTLVIYLGGKLYYKIARIKGWIGLIDSNDVVVFDKDNKRFRVQVIGSSADFI